MTNKSSSAPTRPNYALVGLAIAGVVALALIGLSVINQKRGQAEIDTIRATLCSPLPQDVLETLTRFARDGDAGSGKRTWVMLDGLLSRGTETPPELRVLHKSEQGWREWQRWTEEPVWAYEAPSLELLNGSDCGASFHDGTITVVRRLQLNDVDVLLIAERKRR